MITFAIPCFNSNISFLMHAIESVKMQTLPCWKLIIVDGNQERNLTLESIVLKERDERISYKRNDDDLSMAGNWNFAFDAAETEFVVLLHDDDVLSANYIEEMSKLIDSNKRAALYFCDVFLIDAYGKNVSTVPDLVKSLIKPKKAMLTLEGDIGLSSLLKGCYIFCPTSCYRKSQIKNSPFTNNWKMVTDFQMYFDLLASGKKLTGTNQKLYSYRRHNNNQTVHLTSNFTRFEEEVEFYNMVNKTIGISWVRSKKLSEKKRIIKLHLLYVAFKNAVQLNFRNSMKCFRFFFKLNA
ncbi:glycosyltransferase [Pseudoalteromonas sp. XMcav1-K]|uniref:glycosyltransferase n=1 Tax=Pseudoalteromonas sp. XMcav1-K TaxID=3374372 RepID=UPI003757118F